MAGGILRYEKISSGILTFLFKVLARFTFLIELSFEACAILSKWDTMASIKMFVKI